MTRKNQAKSVDPNIPDWLRKIFFARAFSLVCFDISRIYFGGFSYCWLMYFFVKSPFRLQHQVSRFDKWHWAKILYYREMSTPVGYFIPTAVVLVLSRHYLNERRGDMHQRRHFTLKRSESNPLFLVSSFAYPYSASIARIASHGGISDSLCWTVSMHVIDRVIALTSWWKCSKRLDVVGKMSVKRSNS